MPESATDFPAAPGGPGIADVLESAAASLGVAGAENRLELPQYRRVVVALVDGMGLSVLKRHAAHAPFLRGVADQRRRLTSTFPSTTAAALTSLGTGVQPGVHGIVGYDVLAPEHPRGPKVVNQLGGWDPLIDPDTWQPVESLFQRCEVAGIPSFTVSQKRFKDSALTRASLNGSTFIHAGSSDERVTATVQALAANKRALVYVYWNELDKAGHMEGIETDGYIRTLEDIDFALKRLCAQVPDDTLVLITADHGMLDVPEHGRIDYSEMPELIEGIEFTAGEPRMLHLYWDQNASVEVRERTLAAWREFVGTRAWIGTRDEVIGLGWFGDHVTDASRGRIGDLLVAARTPIALFDGRRVAPFAFSMVGQHGSITPEETGIPLYVIKPASKAKAGRARSGR